MNYDKFTLIGLTEETERAFAREVFLLAHELAKINQRTDYLASTAMVIAHKYLKV